MTREIRSFVYGREYIPTTMAESETCRLLIVTDDQIEVLRTLVNYAHQRRSWNDETIDDSRYYMPSDADWDDIEALVSDLEDKLMSQCDFVTLDDANNRLGINRTAPAQALDVGGRAQIADTSAAILQLYDLTAAAIKGYIYYDNRASQDAVLIKHASGGNQLVLVPSGRVGLSQLAPQGVLHGAGTVGGFLYWETATLNATPQTIVPDGSGDCDRRLSIIYTITDKTSGSKYGTFQTCDNNASARLWSNADCTVDIAVSAAGAITVSRTAGTHDAELAAWLVWS